MSEARRSAVLVLAFAAVACRGPRLPAASSGPPHLTHGSAVGEVTATSAVFWGRCDRATTLRVRLEVDPAERAVAVAAANDFTGKIALASLAPDTRYTYRASCGERFGNAAVTGSFRTAPDPAAAKPVRFVWGGDVGGQNVCRDRQLGYPIFKQIAALQPDFFIGLGDMIYADDGCLPLGRYGNQQLVGPVPATTLAGFWEHWRYNRADEHTQQVLAAAPYYAVWDDHEIRNDSGPHDDDSALAADGHLLPMAMQAFLDYQPLLPPPTAPTRMYRAIRWGRHLELFFLDTRQYRDAIAALDDPAHPKTMLGTEQLTWLEQALAASDATWKVIVASVPLSIPTGTVTGDGFADDGSGRGYEREAARIFAALRADGIRNSIWITTDVHFATGFIYRPFADDAGWNAYEFTSGPLNAGVFPQHKLDASFRPERLFFYGPASPDAIPSYEDAIGWFNFGVIEVTENGAMTVSIINGRGETVYQWSAPASLPGNG